MISLLVKFLETNSGFIRTVSVENVSLAAVPRILEFSVSEFMDERNFRRRISRDLSGGANAETEVAFQAQLQPWGTSRLLSLKFACRLAPRYLIIVTSSYALFSIVFSFVQSLMYQLNICGAQSAC